MFCKKCGNKLNEGQNFCNNCGEKVEKTVENTNVVSEEVETLTENKVEENVNNNITENTSIDFGQYNNVTSTVSSNAEKKKSNLPLIIVFIILGLVIIGLIVFIAVTVVNNSNDDNKGTNTPVTEKEDDNKDTDDIDIDTDDEDDSDVDTKLETITASNYDYSKLSGYKYAIKSNRLYVTDDSSNFIAALQNMSQSYSIIESGAETLKEKFNSTGYTVNRVENKVFGTTKFLAFDMTYGGQNLVLFYAEHPDSTTVCGSVQIKTGYTYTEALEDMSLIITASTKSTGSSSTTDSSSESFDTDISNIF